MKWNFAYPASFLLLWTLATEADSAAPLFFSAEPEDAIVSHGGTLVLYCNVTTTNGEEANVTWFKEGETKPAPSRGSILILSHNADIKHELKEKEKRKIEGSYYCEAQTKILAIRSRSALVKLEHYERATATEGSSFHLNDIVSATASGNFKNVYWKIQCNSIEFTCPSQNRFVCPFFYEELVTERLMRQSLLRIDYNGLQRQGDSTCQKNDPIKLYMLQAHAGKIYVKQFNYNAKSHRPRLYLQPQSLSKQRGHNVTLICQGSNLGNRYIWYKDHKSLSESPRVKMNNGTLFITDVRMQDTGTYTCQSSSGKYTRTKTASLIVYDVPNVSCGNQTCTVSGSNISSVLLIRNGVMLKRMPVDCSSVNLRLHLSGANEGIYQCLANSKYGSAQKSIYLANQIGNETISVNVKRPAHCSNYSKPATGGSGSGSGGSTDDDTSAQSTVDTDSLASGATTTSASGTTASPTDISATDGSTGNALVQTTVKNTDTPATAATMSPSSITTSKATASSSGRTAASLAVSTTGYSTGDISVQPTVVNKDTTAAAATTSTGAMTTSLTESTTGDSTPVQTATTISDATSERSAATNTDKVAKDAGSTTSSPESTKITNAMNQRSLTGIITIGAASGSIVLVLLVIIIVVIACKRKRGHFPITTETAKRAHCRLTSNQSYIRTNSALLESAYATIPEDTAKSGKIAPQMPGLESAVYATVDSCLPKDDGIPKSAQNQDVVEKSSHTSGYADVEKCCTAISHGEQQGSAIAHVSINGDEYAVCQKETTSQQHSTETLSRESTVKHVTVGEDEYALCEKKAENQSKVPDHFTTNGGDTYAVSTKSKETDSSSTKEKKVKRK